MRRVETNLQLIKVRMVMSGKSLNNCYYNTFYIIFFFLLWLFYYYYLAR